jgi:putative addiction module component (TIGR02574 family)
MYNPDMTQETAELLKQALALPEKDRADLAASLIDSLDSEVDVEVEAAWQEEIRSRIEDIRTGKVQTVSWEMVRDRARAILDDKTPR